MRHVYHTPPLQCSPFYVLVLIILTDTTIQRVRLSFHDCVPRWGLENKLDAVVSARRFIRAATVSCEHTTGMSYLWLGGESCAPKCVKDRFWLLSRYHLSWVGHLESLTPWRLSVPHHRVLIFPILQRIISLKDHLQLFCEEVVHRVIDTEFS